MSDEVEDQAEVEPEPEAEPAPEVEAEVDAGGEGTAAPEHEVDDSEFEGDYHDIARRENDDYQEVRYAEVEYERQVADADEVNRWLDLEAEAYGDLG